MIAVPCPLATTRPAQGWWVLPWLDASGGAEAAGTLWRTTRPRVSPGVHSVEGGPDGNPGTAHARIAMTRDSAISANLVKVL